MTKKIRAQHQRNTTAAATPQASTMSNSKSSNPTQNNTSSIVVSLVSLEKKQSDAYFNSRTNMSALQMMEENKRLREENDKLRQRIALPTSVRGPAQIEITGAEGAPVYAHGNIGDATHHGSGRVVQLSRSEEKCGLPELDEAEIHINGLCVGTIRECKDMEDISNAEDQFPNLYFNFDSHCVKGWGDIVLFVDSENLGLDVTFPVFYIDDK